MSETLLNVASQKSDITKYMILNSQELIARSMCRWTYAMLNINDMKFRTVPAKKHVPKNKNSSDAAPQIK